MAEYIKRDTVIRAVMAAKWVDGSDGAMAMEIVASLLAANVAPVVHGHWIWHEEEHEYECSACYCRFDYNPTFENFDHGFHYANWCPYCGAKMDGGANDES